MLDTRLFTSQFVRRALRFQSFRQYFRISAAFYSKIKYAITRRGNTEHLSLHIQEEIARGVFQSLHTNY